MQEKWRDVVGYEGYYEVSNLGRVRSLDRVVQRRGHALQVGGRILRPGTRHSGHLGVTLWRGNKGTTFGVHRIVALAFLGASPIGGYEVCHDDGDPTNNAASNLRWDSHQSNMADTERHGTRARGRRLPQAVLTPRLVQKIRADYDAGLGTHRSLAEKYGLSHQSIGVMLRGESWAWVKPHEDARKKEVA